MDALSGRRLGQEANGIARLQPVAKGVPSSAAAQLDQHAAECDRCSGALSGCEPSPACIHEMCADGHALLMAAMRSAVQARGAGGRPGVLSISSDPRIDRSGGPDSCHTWTGRLDRDGYAVVNIAGKGTVRVCRLACEAKHGPPPFKGAEAAHSCDVNGCCNGEHLSWATRKQNVADQLARGHHRNCKPHGKPYACGRCNGLGHNARTCSAPASPQASQ